MSIEFTDVVEEMRLEVVVWIVANNGCGNGDESRAAEDRVFCLGTSGRFKMIGCPLLGFCKGKRVNSVEAGKAFLYEHFKWHSQQKAEAAKEQEQKVKQEPVRICGNCNHIHEVEKSENMIAHCDMKNSIVPILFDRCPDFEPRTGEESALERLSAVIKSGAEAAEASSKKIVAEYLSRIANTTQLADTEEKKEMRGEVGYRSSFALPPDVSVSDIICTFIASAPPRKPSACAAKLEADRIAQLEKENAELQSTNRHLREELVRQFEQLLNKTGTLQDQNDRLRGELDAATKKKNSMDSRLIEQLKQMGQRVKDLEREAGERSWPPRPRFFL